MSESVFESFEAYLKGADYPKGKKKIMQAAVDLISTKGYNGTSTLQIAKHAGLSQATLFKYFKTKEDLLTAILHPVVPGLFGRFFEELSDELMEKNLLFTPKRSEEELFMEESGRSYYNSYLNNARSSILTYQGRSGGGFSGGNSYGEKRAGEKKNAFGSLDSLKQSGLLQKGFTSAGKEKPDYKEGDRVSHMKFGEGTVLTIEDGERDYTITVEFDQFGIKKMMAGFAKLIKI